jgi:ATP-dependent exoDNAse (exonuclease V) beta subunit
MTKIPLKVYKASAGSGKTFTLAVEYIKLLIEDPLAYRHILAVTFTNKATEEMKVRILSQLNGLAHHYPDSNDYMAIITRDLGYSEDYVASQAQKALQSLLHHYSYFRVETIDKFFQRILRNLARELDLPPNLRIELNDKQVEQLAVDHLIESLSINDTVLNWLMSYIIENIHDDKSWNIIGNVKRFGEHIFKDDYKQYRERLHAMMSDEHFFDHFKQQMMQIRANSLRTMQAHADLFFIATKGYGIQDFKYGNSGVYNYFIKLANGKFDGGECNKYVMECMVDARNWSKESHPHHAEITLLAQNQLMDILEASERDRRRCYQLSKSAEVTLRNINQLRLLGVIEERVRQLNDDSNRFLLSDTQGMLHALIDNSDTPFIYERIGAPLHHIMIDEFQDTSTLQWSNFKVMLDDCMDRGYGNLIVGDVKQSIYRWRSGDWRLLNNIQDQFVHNTQMVKEIPLETNFRSDRRIVYFNNLFFTLASKIEYNHLLDISGSSAEQILSAYSDVCQAVPSKKGDDGYVRIELMSAEAHRDTIMQRIADDIHSLTSHGITQDKIAILARGNKEIEAIAYYFQNNVPDVNIVSDEAFRLDSSVAVNTIVTALRVLVNEQDVLRKATLAKTYQQEILNKSLNDNDLLLNSPPQDPLSVYQNWLPEGFRNISDYAHLRSKPLSELIETIYTLFSLQCLPDQSAYICTFYDLITEHLQENTSDIERFLSAWDESYHEKNIHGDNVNGVRIVTIHKSKGLEFDNVIIPFCNWPLEKSTNNILWCQSDEPPFNQLPVVPIGFSKNGMINTIYEKDYQQEHLQNMVDNLNLLYVAFTRARKRLLVYGTTKKDKDKKSESTNNRSLLIEKCMPLLVQPVDETSLNPHQKGKLHTLEDSTLDNESGKPIVFEYGQCYDALPVIQKKEKDSSNIFLHPDLGEEFQMLSYHNHVKFRQSNNSRKFTTSEETTLLRANYIERGNLLHHIFSQLRSVDDIEDVIHQLTNEGILYDEISPQELKDMLDRALSNKKVQDWFSPRWTLHNECTIITHDPKTHQDVSHRPDRVMSDGKRTIVVDFKFGKPSPLHHAQVQTYMQLLHEMGYDNIEGYLWYVSLNKTQRVRPTS